MSNRTKLRVVFKAAKVIFRLHTILTSLRDSLGFHFVAQILKPIVAHNTIEIKDAKEKGKKGSKLSFDKLPRL